MKKNLFKNILLPIFLILNSSVLLADSFVTDGEIKEIKLKLKNFGINKASSEALLKGIQGKTPVEIERQLLKSVNSDKRNYLAYYVLGAYYEDEKYGNNKEKALKYYEKALEANPDVPFIYEKLGSSYRKTGNYAKALEIYEKMIKKFPELPEGYSAAGTINVYKGDESKGSEYLSKSVELYNREKGTKKAENFSIEREVLSLETADISGGSMKRQREEKAISQSISEKKYNNALSMSQKRKEDILQSSVLQSSSMSSEVSNFKDKIDENNSTDYSKNKGEQKRYERKNEQERIKAEIASIFVFFEKKEYRKGFLMFFEKYSDIVDILDDKNVEETVEIIKKYNEKIKDIDKNLYEENRKKFKELDIF